MQLRRDVFLEAAEGLAGAIEQLFQNARTDVPLGSPPAQKGRPGWLFKIYLVGKTDTLIAFSEASAAVAASTLDVFTHRAAVAQIDDQIAIVRATIERIQSFQEEMRSEARAIDLNNPTERALKRLEWVKEQLDETWKQMGEETQKLEALVNEHSHRLRSLLERSMQLAVDVQKTARTALLAARLELEVSIDQSKFESAAARVDDRMTSKLSEMLQLLEASSS